MVRETNVTVDDLILPLFVRHGENIKDEIASMPGNYQMSVDQIVEECKQVHDLGIPAVIFFGIPEKKDSVGSEAYADNGIVQQTLRAVKKSVPELMLITDVCLCEYTDHGHCGVIENNDVENDKTLELLAKSALSFAQAGADMVAPSDMMDGRVKAIRKILDGNGFSSIPIMAYSAKYTSSFYGPFRDAAESPPQFGDRKTYQMDIANSREAMEEIKLDVDEGADIIMVKPALSYLDIIVKAREKFDLPIAAYHVSGEFSMIKAAAKLGWIDETQAMLEVLLSIKRAGADLILTYFAKDFARLSK